MLDQLSDRLTRTIYTQARLPHPQQLDCSRGPYLIAVVNPYIARPLWSQFTHDVIKSSKHVQYGTTYSAPSLLTFRKRLKLHLPFDSHILA